MDFKIGDLVTVVHSSDGYFDIGTELVVCETDGTAILVWFTEGTEGWWVDVSDIALLSS